MNRILAALLAPLALSLSLVACSDEDQGSDHNDADVAFAQQMIPHHRQAIMMARLADSRASNAAVLTLARDIETAQRQEIKTFEGWLDDWGQDASGHGMDGSHMDHDSMDGMLDAGQMRDLRDATGTAFDRLFLASMIEHHEGAVTMARTEVDDGESSDAIALAEKIAADQAAEIEAMRELLG